MKEKTIIGTERTEIEKSVILGRRFLTFNGTSPKRVRRCKWCRRCKQCHRCDWTRPRRIRIIAKPAHQEVRPPKRVRRCDWERRSLRQVLLRRRFRPPARSRAPKCRFREGEASPEPALIKIKMKTAHQEVRPPRHVRHHRRVGQSARSPSPKWRSREREAPIDQAFVNINK
jgi:hypothetical protein